MKTNYEKNGKRRSTYYQCNWRSKQTKKWKFLITHMLSSTESEVLTSSKIERPSAEIRSLSNWKFSITHILSSTESEVSASSNIERPSTETKNLSNCSLFLDESEISKLGLTFTPILFLTQKRLIKIYPVSLKTSEYYTNSEMNLTNQFIIC